MLLPGKHEMSASAVAGLRTQVRWCHRIASLETPIEMRKVAGRDGAKVIATHVIEKSQPLASAAK